MPKLNQRIKDLKDKKNEEENWKEKDRAGFNALLKVSSRMCGY